MDPYQDHNRQILSPLDVPKQPEDEPKEKAQLEQSESFITHMSELRKVIIISIAIVVVFFILILATIQYWFPYVTKNHELLILGPLEVLSFYMSVSTALAIGLSLPFISHVVWRFVQPGLKEQEASFLKIYSPVMFLLFMTGIAFGYFIVHPLSYQFLLSLGAIHFTVLVSAEQYIHFLLMTTLPIGLLFELPILTLFLYTIGLLQSDGLIKVRKVSYVVLAIVSAIITPPDFISQLLVLIPMILLYEASIFFVRRAEKKEIYNETEQTN